MTTNTKTQILYSAASIFMYLFVFSKPLGMEAISPIFLLVSMIFLYFGLRTFAKGKKSGDIQPAGASKKKQRFWLLVIVMACA